MKILALISLLVVAVSAVPLPKTQTSIKDSSHTKTMPVDTSKRPAPLIDSAGEQTFSIDVKDSDIRDVVRMVSTGYQINVVIDQSITGKITLHLTNVPVMSGLRTLAGTLGLVVVKSGLVYRICKESDEQLMQVDFNKGKLSADLHNADVRQFIAEVSRLTGASIVIDQHVDGKISGKLYGVEVEDGLKAMLESNGFEVVKRKNIFSVASNGVDASQTPMPGTPQFGGGGSAFRPSGNGRNFFVECKDDSISINVAAGDLDDVIKAIATQTNLDIVTYGELRGTVINAKLTNVPIEVGMRLLLGGTRFTFIKTGNIIMIGDRSVGTPSGQALSKSELIHLKHTKADEVPKLIPQGMFQNNISVDKEQNALLVSGTSEDILKIREFLSSIDVPTPQVVIDVLVVEYSRDVGRKMGLSVSSGTGAAASVSWPDISVNSNMHVQTPNNYVGKLTGNFIQLPTDFNASLQLLESENKAKVLAQPSLCVLNGNKASINVGQTQYFTVTGGTKDVPTTEFRPISFGIQLDITPWISQSGQITAELTPNISNSMGVSANGYPNVFQRSITTTVRLENGQTLALGGLLRGDEQTLLTKVPLLGDIPFIGALFRKLNTDKVQTNLVIYITPHILDSSYSVDLANDIKSGEKAYSRPVPYGQTFGDMLKTTRGNFSIKLPDSSSVVQDSVCHVPTSDTSKTVQKPAAPLNSSSSPTKPAPAAMPSPPASIQGTDQKGSQ